MAQMIAKAMAKSDVSAADKALIDKLAAEFSDELNNLGVRVSNLERNADMVKWTGKAEYTYKSNRNTDEGLKDNSDHLLFRLEPTAEVNSNWHVKARLDASTEMNKDKANDDNDKVDLKRIWAQGDYSNFQVKLGKFAQIDDDSIFDTTFSGAEVSFGNKVTFTAGAGRLNLVIIMVPAEISMLRIKSLMIMLLTISMLALAMLTASLSAVLITII